MIAAGTNHGSHFDRFVGDVARWVRPEQVADRSELTPRLIARLLFHYPALRAMAWFRLAASAKQRGVRMVPNLVRRRIQRVYGVELDPGADIAGGLYLAHPVGCTLIAESIGENVSIMSCVTIGRLAPERWPRLGDRVFIGSGARVLGPIEVGDDAVIGANAVVVRDVEPGATAVGIPARAR